MSLPIGFLVFDVRSLRFTFELAESSDRLMSSFFRLIEHAQLCMLCDDAYEYDGDIA